MKKIVLFAWGMAMLSAAATAEAAVCTSLSAGDWNVVARWNCGHIPVAADTVVIAHNAIRMRGNYTVAGITINAGAVLNDDGNNLTVNGNVVINGQLGTNQGGALRMRTAGATLSGTGIVKDIVIEIDAANITIPAGSLLDFDPNAEIDVGANLAGSLTIDGTVTAATQTAGDRVIRVSSGGALTIGTSGVVNAPNSRLEIRTNASLLNNGNITVRELRGRTGAPAPVVTQGINSNLTVSIASCVAASPCTFDASATGNTVTFNGTSTVIAPSAAGYWNLAGTIFPGACPVAYTISGTSPCPAGGPVSVTMNPSNCVNVTGIGTLAWATPANVVSTNNTYSTVSLNDLQVSNFIRCTGYGFAIPADATINGITVNVERRASNTNSVRDAAMRLVKDAAGLPVIQATDRSTLTNYTTADVVQAHGGVADLWGGTWTAADINSTNFGAAFASQKPGTAGGARTVSVDHMPITVSYTTSVFHHASINVPATAMTSSEVPVVVAPHTSAHGAVTAAGTINLSTSTGTGNWTIGSGTGTLTPGAANSGLASYTFGAGESSVTLGFTSLAAGAVTLNVAFGGTDMLLNTPAGEKANTITFSTASFVFTSSACTHNVAFGTPGQCANVVWSPRTAGLSLASVYITSVDAAGVPTRLHPTQVRTRNIQFGLSCHDPVANAGVQAIFSATAVALPLCQANGATPVAWTAGVDLSFAGGSPSVGPYSFGYADVGKVELWMRNSAATTELGSSGQFVVRPAGFTLSNIKRSGDNFANPGAANAGGTAFVKAGEMFTVSVTALNASGIATPNYGKEISAESVKLTPTLVAGLGLTNNPAVNGSFAAFASGLATGAAFRWGEVGIITLTPSVGDADYLGAGDVTGTPSGNVGRFSLGKFALQNIALDDRADLCQGGFLVSDGVTPCAPAFTYMGEQIDANFTLVPKSLNEVNVLNYVDSATAANDFAKLDPSTFANLNLAAVDRTTAGGPYYLTARISNAAMPVATCATALCFQTGSADVTVPFVFGRNAAADGAYGSVELGIAPVDSDGARLEGPGATPSLCNNPNTADCYDLDSDALAGNDRALLATTEFRYGRMKLSNAHGSELLPLSMPVKLEYWNGTGYATNVDDTLSVLAFTLGNYTSGLNAGETILTAPLFVSGVGQLMLSAPGSGNSGSVDVTATSPSYLPGDAGRAIFGVYKGTNEFIYLREAY
ncbi:MAG: hypothetical protein Q7T25_05465 [Sideroxyarcus sp.]|nr:hypothetical protein [Sideroxyarcus sp.]